MGLAGAIEGGPYRYGLFSESEITMETSPRRGKSDDNFQCLVGEQPVYL